MAHIPARDDILKFISEQNGKVGKREIARAFNIKGSDRIPLKALLREMAAEGLLEGNRRAGLRQAGALPAVAVLKITARDEDGFFLAQVTQKQWADTDNPPRIIINETTKRGAIARRHKQIAMGDTVLARLTRTDNHTYEARIIRKLTQNTAPIVGQVQMRQNQLWLLPANRRERYDYLIDTTHSTITVSDGDLVIAEKQASSRFGARKVRLIENIGAADAPCAFSRLAIAEQGIPDIFPEAVQAQVARITPLTNATADDTRADLTQLPFITIDPHDARDHDDAVFAEANPTGGFILWVAIADVAAYVAAHSALDKEALKRGNSVYLPDRVVPMLPERLSADLCSLKVNEIRPCLAVKIHINALGQVQTHTFMRGWMRSVAALDYEQAQACFDGTPPRALDHLTPILKPLWQAYQSMAQARDKRAPLDLDIAERRIVLDAQGNITDIHTPPRLEAHRLIEEMMIAANVCAAKTLQKRKLPFIYRIHEPPPRERTHTLAQFLHPLKLKLDLGQPMRPALFNGILQHARRTPHYDSVSEVILRTQTQAIYTTDNCGHFGLNLDCYTHFTSPIRRYSDVLVHRALIASLGLGTDGSDDTSLSQLSDTAEHISTTERRAMVAERATADRYLSAFMANAVGQDFNARIAGMSRAGLFVKLNTTGADGIIPMSKLGDEHFSVDKNALTLTGTRTGVCFRLGDKIRVTLLEATPIKGGLLFAPVKRQSL